VGEAERGLAPEGSLPLPFSPKEKTKEIEMTSIQKKTLISTRTFFNEKRRGKKLVRENHWSKDIELGLPAAKLQKIFETDS
jgi:hypothetical protein